ncbi:MAG: hypothetical protein PHW33_01500 [Candidatus Portnoybacteria bacterium]|nr:hypothetical protein [Candidatus Portnoybacteria bacterium]
MPETTSKPSLESEVSQIAKGQSDSTSGKGTADFSSQFSVRTMKSDLERLGGRQTPAKTHFLEKLSAPAAPPPTAKPIAPKEKKEKPVLDVAAQKKRQAMEELSQSFQKAQSLISVESWDDAQKELQKISGSADASWWLRWKTKRLLGQIAKERDKKIISGASFTPKPMVAEAPPTVPASPAKTEPPAALPIIQKITPRALPEAEPEKVFAEKPAIAPSPARTTTEIETEKMDVDKILDNLGNEAPSLNPLLKKIPTEKKTYVPRPEKPTPTAPAIPPSAFSTAAPALPANKRRLILIVSSLVILLALSGWWWWRSQESQPTVSQTPTPSQTTPTPLVLPSSPFEVSQQLVVDLLSSQPATTKNRLLNEMMSSGTPAGHLSQIVFKDSDDNQWAGFDKITKALEIDFFELLAQKCDSAENNCANVPIIKDYLNPNEFSFLAINTASGTSTSVSPYAWRMGIIIDLKPTASSSSVLAAFKNMESSLVSNAGFLWLGQEISVLDNFFQDNLYRQTPIRYQNLSTPATSFDYAIFEDKLVIATSKSAMYAIIDRLSGTIESSASPSASSFPASNQLNVPY